VAAVAVAVAVAVAAAVAVAVAAGSDVVAADRFVVEVVGTLVEATVAVARELENIEVVH